MPSLLQPFSGFIPSVDFAHRIVGPPSSLLAIEQKEVLRQDELNFRSVVGRGAAAHYETAMSWLQRCHDIKALRAVDSSVIVHQLTRDDFAATGLLADVSLNAYDAGRVKRHEATITKTERKMFEYMQSTRIFGNPVALTHHDDANVDALLASHTERSADVTFEAIDGTQHALWIVGGDQALELCASLDDVLYVTDGHHRLAGASLLAKTEGMSNAHIPAGLFAESELRVWAYARTLVDPNLNAQSVLDSLRERFELQESALAIPRPSTPTEMGLRIGSQSYVLTIPQSMLPADPYDRIAVNLLHDLILGPCFGITDASTDDRLSFVADTGDQAHNPDDYDAWFLPHPTSPREVMEAADIGRTMPPKSTYFLPKLASGLVIRPIDIS